ncbi:MAG: heterodisulfide reductase-related iron-sulfur binding cluster [Burkholderiales bacterium]
MSASSFAEALQARGEEVLDRCTRCGGCFEVCPTSEAAGLGGRDARAVVSGVLDIIRGGPGSPDSERWAQTCSQSGKCIQRCRDGVNPRFMLALARVAMQRRASPEERHRKGSAAFSTMGKSVRVLSRIQLPVHVLARFRAERRSERKPDVVFYTGCNVVRTPHIVLLCLDILDALGVSYRVMGGPADCCGVLQFRTGDIDASGKIAYGTTDRFAATGAPKVLSWCPTCQVQIGEVVMPGRTSSGETPYELEALVVYLANQLERLRPLLRHRVEKRVGLHEHPGVAGVSEAAERILRAIPGVEFVDLEQPRVGYMCNTLQHVPAYKRELHRALLETAAAAGVTTLAGVYHACHRELCSHEAEWPFEVVNFLERVGESMGIRHEDHFKRLKKMQNTEAILADVMDLVRAHGLKPDEVREVIDHYLLGEQPLPLRGAAEVATTAR